MIKDCHLQFDMLEFDFNDIYLSMGKDYRPDEVIDSMLDSIKIDVASHCNPQYHYTVFKASESKQNYVKLEDTFLHTGSTITPYIKNADYYILFVATAGHQFEEYQQQVKETGDILNEFLLDVLGSAIAEAVVKEVCKDVEKRASEYGYGVSYPYSPGYCGWSVKEQQVLFQFLPNHPATVSLSESSLMTPIKSVSGIIAVGQHIVKKKYGCEICTKTNCYKNRNK